MTESIFDKQGQLPLAGDYSFEKGSHNIHHQIPPGTKFNLMQAKTLNVLQYLLQKSVNDIGLTPEQYLREYPGNLTNEIKLSELQLLTGTKSTNSKFLKNLMDEMQDIRMTCDTLSDDEHLEQASAKGEYGFVNMLNYCIYSRGKIQYMLPPYAVRYLLLNTNAATIDLIKGSALTCKYAYFLYEYVEEAAQKEQKDQFSFTIDHDKLLTLFKMTFELDENKNKVYTYADPATVKNKAVKPAVEDFNNADLRFEIVDYSYHKTSHKQVVWYFQIVSKRSLVVHEFSNKNALEIAEVKQRMQQYGVSEPLIKKLLDSLSTENELQYIQYNLDKVKAALSRNDVSNAGGLFVRCMENNRDAFEAEWVDLQKEKETARLLRKIQFEKDMKRMREKHVDELIDNRCMTTVEKLREDPSLLAQYLYLFGEYLEKIPTASAAKLRAEIVEAQVSLKTLDDPIFYRFLRSHVEKNLSEQDKDRYVADKGTYFGDN